MQCDIPLHPFVRINKRKMMSRPPSNTQVQRLSASCLLRNVEEKKNSLLLNAELDHLCRRYWATDLTKFRFGGKSEVGASDQQPLECDKGSCQGLSLPAGDLCSDDLVCYEPLWMSSRAGWGRKTNFEAQSA
mmetsp:Transcript_27682/g.90165  ORF Transcript_27682/g.90165 Transcript_27682/m.90165 type:complete len:132 (-) Transcript_27682:114-509(-)